MLGTIALVYNAYVGFEVIADDAEEIINPNRNIPWVSCSAWRSPP